MGYWRWLWNHIKQIPAQLATPEGELLIGVILLTGGTIAPIGMLRNELGLLLSTLSGVAGFLLWTHAYYRAEEDP